MVSVTFWIIASLMLLAALAFVLAPLLRTGGAGEERAKRAALEQARRTGALSHEEVDARLAALPRATPIGAGGSRWLPIALGLALPLAAIGLYREIGEPRALDQVWQGAVAAAAGNLAQASADGENAPDMEQAVSGLAERLRENPDDLEGWMLLGRAYKTLERFAPAAEALANAYRLAPDNPEVMVDYAEAQVLASDTRRFSGEPLQLLERALQADPDLPRALWLRGIAHYHENDFAAATVVWERLLAAMPPEAEARNSLLERIAETRQRAGLEPLAETATAAATATPSAATNAPPAAAPAPVTSNSAGPSLTVTVDIAPELKARIAPSDVLFVFARAAEGPRMPLAIQRLPAGSLPVTVTLDDSTSMMPALKLSTMPQVVVGARVSKSGQATPQSGDFETLSAPIANTHSAPIALTIDKVVP
jgi:cytochrome c-type biogenesis protein CcmH